MNVATVIGEEISKDNKLYERFRRLKCQIFNSEEVFFYIWAFFIYGGKHE